MNRAGAIQKSEYSRTIVSQTFWGLFPALVAANLIPTLSGIINGLLVGNAFSPVSMAAVSFANPVNRIIRSIAAMFSSGAGISYGRYLGRGQSENLHKVYTLELSTLATIGLALTIIGEIFTVQIVQLAGASGESLSETVVYLRGLFIGIIPMMIIPSLVTFLNLGNEAKYGMLSSLVLAACNLIFGLLNVNVFRLGMFGMGLSSSLAQYGVVAFLLIRFVKRPELGHFVKVADIAEEIGSMVTLGAPSGVVDIASSVRNMIINSMTLSTGGTLAVAGFGVMCSSSGFFCAVIPALTSATATMASICVGEEDRAAVFGLARYLLRIGAIIFIGTAAVYFTAAPLLARLFGVSAEGMVFAVNAIRIYAFEFVTSWFVHVTMGIYQSLGRSALASVMNVLQNFVYALAVIYISAALLPEGMKVYGVWSSFAVGALLAVITLLIIAWVKSGHFPCRVEYILWLNRDFGVEADDRMTITVRNIDEVVKVSERVQNFCISRGIDRKRSMHVAICLEEIAGNIVSIGFPKCEGKKDLVADIYVAVKDYKVFIRIKDNATEYDPFRKLDMYKEEDGDPIKNFGIHVIAKLAKDMKYQTTLGMNVLMMTI